MQLVIHSLTDSLTGLQTDSHALTIQYFIYASSSLRGLNRIDESVEALSSGLIRHKDDHSLLSALFELVQLELNKEFANKK